MWTNWKPFNNNKNYSIRDRDYWNKFWDNCPYTEKQIYLALRNISYACNHEHYEERYISPDPCQFIKGGMLTRGLYHLESEYNNDHGDWKNPESEDYDENLRLFKE